jgi:hypothetical protein
MFDKYGHSNDFYIKYYKYYLVSTGEIEGFTCGRVPLTTVEHCAIKHKVSQPLLLGPDHQLFGLGVILLGFEINPKNTIFKIWILFET